MLRISCFTTFQAFIDDLEITRFRSAKERALLIYLAVEQDATHQRAPLAGLLWPDEPEAKARHNLSQTLVNLRKAIGDREAEPPYLLITPQTLAFNPESDHQVDVGTFVHHLADGSTQAQQAAIDLYTGPFLDDFVVAESDLLQNWILTQRERLHQQALDAFSSLRAHYENNGELQQAQQVVRRLLALAPWQEEAHRQLMRLLALSGERTMALAQYDILAQILMDELGVSPSDETNTLYNEILSGAIIPSSSSSQSSPTPFQVTAPLPHFVGREQEFEQIQELLNKPDTPSTPSTPIVALVGMGGLGKTTLATQIAHAARDNFADGVLWANPAISSVMDILENWGRAYGYDFSGLSDVESRGAAVRGVLAEKSTLLVLDNVTHASQVKPMLAGGKRCPILLTTRDLDVAHALNAEVIALGELSAQSGRDLLFNILGAERVEAEPDEAQQICQLLHYLPLAIEIAAQRLKSRARMSLGQMAQRLGDTRQRLGLKISDQAVRASFEVSWDGLDVELQAFFPLLAVFEGRPFTVDALAHVAEMDLFDVEDLLYGLNALSLVKEDEAAYFRQHPLLADFAREKLDSPAYHQQHDLVAEMTGGKLADADAAYGRLVDYYLGFVEENRQNYDVLEPEWGNIGAAIEVAHRLEKWGQVLTFSDRLEQTWLTRSRYGDARSAYRLAQDAAEKGGDQRKLATNLLRWGRVCIEQSAYDEAKKWLEQSLILGYQLEEGVAIADARYHLAQIAIDRNQFAEAEQALEECKAIRAELGDKAGIANVFYAQASLYYDYGPQYAKSECLALQALRIQEEVSDSLEHIYTLQLLAQLSTETEELQTALTYAHKALDLCERLASPTERASTLCILVMIHLRGAEYTTAQRYAEESLTVVQHVGYKRVEGMTLHQLSNIAKAHGDLAAAISLENQSLHIFRTLDDKMGSAYSLRNLGDLYAQQKEFAKSQSTWQEAKKLAQVLRHTLLIDSISDRLQDVNSRHV